MSYMQSFQMVLLPISRFLIKVIRKVLEICREIRKRGLDFRWEYLGRVDSIDKDLAMNMKEAGCDRIFFGIESGNDGILRMMNKKITVGAARKAVYSAHEAGIRTGAFYRYCIKKKSGSISSST